MTTATEQMEKTQSLRQSTIYGERVEYFLRRYAPHDKYEAREFERDFHILIRECWVTAQEPILKQMGEVFARLPIPGIMK